MLMNAQLVGMTVMQMRGARITKARLLVPVRKVLKETGKNAKVMTIDMEYLGSVYTQIG